MAQELPGADSLWQSQHLKITIIAFFLVGIFLLAFGGGLFFFKGQSSGDIQIISASPNQPWQGKEIVVHVDGAVWQPGVYRLQFDARVVDAVTAAGGLAGSADGARINLAAKLTDGQKIYIPKIGESAVQGVSGSASRTLGESQNQPVNINTASESELDRLPGIGPVTAKKIIASRPYGASEDLLTRKVVSKSVFEKIKDMIGVY